MAKYVQSTVWLLGCSGLGYALLVATTPSKEQLKEAQKVGYNSEMGAKIVI